MLKRITAIFQAKANKALDSVEDPREMLDLSYTKQLDMLRDVKRSMVDVAASRQQLERRAAEQRATLEKFDTQARAALGAGREDLARIALERKQGAVEQLESFEAEAAQLAAEEARLIDAEGRLRRKVESFKTRKEILKAQYSAAKATARVGEAVTGLSEEANDVGAMIQRAEDRTAQLRARGDAITHLIDSGVLDDALGPNDSVDRELRAVTASATVESELEAMKRQLAAGNTNPQISDGSAQ